MKVSLERQPLELKRFEFGPEGNKVVFLVKARAFAWDRERVRILATSTSDVIRNAIEAMVVGWEGVEDDNGAPRGFQWAYLVALAEADGFDGVIASLGAFVINETNALRDTERGQALKKTPDGS